MNKILIMTRVDEVRYHTSAVQFEKKGHCGFLTFTDNIGLDTDILIRPSQVFILFFIFWFLIPLHRK